MFTESKIVTSVYNSPFEGALSADLASKIKFDEISDGKIATINTPTHTNILKSAIENSDAIIHGSETMPEDIVSFITAQNKPVLEFQSDDLKEPYLNFYADILSVN